MVDNIFILGAIEAGQVRAFLLGVWLGQLKAAGLWALLVKATYGQPVRPNLN